MPPSVPHLMHGLGFKSPVFGWVELTVSHRHKSLAGAGASLHKSAVRGTMKMGAGDTGNWWASSCSSSAIMTPYRGLFTLFSQQKLCLSYLETGFQQNSCSSSLVHTLESICT